MFNSVLPLVARNIRLNMHARKHARTRQRVAGVGQSNLYAELVGRWPVRVIGALTFRSWKL